MKLTSTEFGDAGRFVVGFALMDAAEWMQQGYDGPACLFTFGRRKELRSGMFAVNNAYLSTEYYAENMNIPLEGHTLDTEACIGLCVLSLLIDRQIDAAVIRRVEDMLGRGVDAASIRAALCLPDTDIDTPQLAHAFCGWDVEDLRCVLSATAERFEHILDAEDRIALVPEKLFTAALRILRSHAKLHDYMVEQELTDCCAELKLLDVEKYIHELELRREEIKPGVSSVMQLLLRLVENNPAVFNMMDLLVVEHGKPRLPELEDTPAGEVGPPTADTEL
jgi:hypothetical protein